MCLYVCICLCRLPREWPWWMRSGTTSTPTTPSTARGKTTLHFIFFLLALLTLGSLLVLSKKLSIHIFLSHSCIITIYYDSRVIKFIQSFNHKSFTQFIFCRLGAYKLKQTTVELTHNMSRYSPSSPLPSQDGYVGTRGERHRGSDGGVHGIEATGPRLHHTHQHVTHSSHQTRLCE